MPQTCDHPYIVRFEVYFDTFNRLGVNRECDRHRDRHANGRTDILIANAALHKSLRYAAINQ